MDVLLIAIHVILFLNEINLEERKKERRFSLDKSNENVGFYVSAKGQEHTS